ncbi:hypothetical protein DERP_002941 [Dermatophagoides pteronyssinus]|uniref:Uncharacterized protein n=1 Tax=Dermatophagoides pteronyssinus TaxID=6956 RepID=A0ABQ8JW60_DERPT|nr:hypothetical protein DERP_002941 [Dermatophagoides pteronyssinus]
MLHLSYRRQCRLFGSFNSVTFYGSCRLDKRNPDIYDQATNLVDGFLLNCTITNGCSNEFLLPFLDIPLVSDFFTPELITIIFESSRSSIAVVDDDELFKPISNDERLNFDDDNDDDLNYDYVNLCVIFVVGVICCSRSSTFKNANLSTTVDTTVVELLPLDFDELHK